MAESYPLITKDWSFLLPNWAPYGRIGVKLNRLLQTCPEVANVLWSKSLLKIAHNKNWPHCSTCDCCKPEESELPELLLDEEISSSCGLLTCSVTVQSTERWCPFMAQCRTHLGPVCQLSQSPEIGPHQLPVMKYPE